MKVERLPTHDSFNGWTNSLSPRQYRPALASDTRIPLLIIGAGAAGLAAARSAAILNPNQEVVLLEAAKLGDGASARNSGFVIDLPHNVGADLNDLDTLKRSLRIARSATQWLSELVETHEIDCQWSPQGQYMAAKSKQGSKVLDGFIKGLDLLNEPYKDLDRSQIRAGTGLEYYHRAIKTPGTVLMQPAALMRGLGDSLPSNVRFYENTPVTHIDYGKTIRVQTPLASVVADKVILAVNGFAPFLGQLKRQVFTLQAFASMTRPLDKSEREALGNPSNWGMVPAMAFGGPTIRYTMDHRIIMRSFWRTHQRDTVSKAAYADSRALQKKQINARFPMIKNDPIEHTWTGQVALAQNFAPGFGQLAPNVFSAMVQNGVGMTKGTMAGKLAAEMASDKHSSLLDDMLALGKPSKLPPQPLLSIGMFAKVRWWEWTSRFER